MHGTSVSAHSRMAARLATSTAALALGLGLSGCGAVESFDKATSDAWSVTYEVTVSGSGAGAQELSNVSYLEATKRGEPSAAVNAGSVEATSDPKDKNHAAWSVEAIVTAEQDAGVSATPAKDTSATCRILLDGMKEIAAQTGKPGEPVNCTVTTPAFSSKG